MKLSLQWLKDYVDPKLSTEELVERLTMAGLEVEEIHTVSGDTVLDLEITPNRPDCLNTIGLAREISAITAKNLKLPKIKAHKPTAKKCAVSIQDKKECSRYIATLIKDVHVAPSPPIITARLNALGINAINNAVDSTNFVLMELGQPLHVFDYDKLVGGKIIVRRAKTGESIVTLDGVERKLDESILIIADAQKPVAIAGVMGGLETGVTAATKNILLESAHFDMGLVRRAGRKLGLKSDSLYRFERGIDIEGVLTGANRATDWLLELTKGKITARTDINYTKKSAKQTITLSINDIEELLGTQVSASQVKSSLLRLGLKIIVSKSGGFKVVPPSFRGDLKQPVDIIEEVARIIGYDRLAMSFPHIQVANIVPNSRPRQMKQICEEILLASGYSETINYSLISQKDLIKSGLEAMPAIALHNALSQEHCILRPSLLPSMLSVAAFNFNHGQKNLRLFEIGKRYFKGERTTLAILATGKRTQDWRSNSKDSINFYDLKGVLEQVFARLNVPISFDPCDRETLDVSARVYLKLNGECAGIAGKVARKVLTQWDIKNSEVYFASVDLHAFQALPPKQIKHERISEFPAINRDVSLAVKKDVTYARIEELCRKFGGSILKDIHLIEEYTGDKIQNGLRGLVFSLAYQSKERTLREEEVNAAHQLILKALADDLGAIQR